LNLGVEDAVRQALVVWVIKVDATVRTACFLAIDISEVHDVMTCKPNKAGSIASLLFSRLSFIELTDDVFGYFLVSARLELIDIGSEDLVLT